MVTKFVDLHSHDLSSSNKVHHFYSHQIYRSKMSRTIMTNLDDVGMRSSNIAHVVNVMNHEEDCEQVSAQQCIDYIWHKNKNIGQEFISIIKYFQVKSESDSDFFFLCQWGWSCKHTKTCVLGWQKNKIFLLKFFWHGSVLHNIQD